MFEEEPEFPKKRKSEQEIKDSNPKMDKRRKVFFMDLTFSPFNGQD